jgi:hypothetical protein
MLAGLMSAWIMRWACSHERLAVMERARGGKRRATVVVRVASGKVEREVMRESRLAGRAVRTMLFVRVSRPWKGMMWEEEFGRAVK